MLKNPTTTLILVLLLMCGCKSAQSNQPATAQNDANAAQVATASPAAVAATPSASAPVPGMANGPKDPCSLLTSDEIRAVQGEPLKTTKRDDRSAGQLLISICYYELPTPVNSISLAVTQSNGSKTGAVREHWEETFGQDERKSEKERERERKKAEPRQEGEEEEEGAPMERVSGVGEEAFWSASRVGGALFVLKKDRYIRISVGGKGDAEAKLKKSRILAVKVLTALG